MLPTLLWRCTSEGKCYQHASGEARQPRFTKDVIDELGHTLGFIHCHTPSCVMRSSTYVEDIDQKEVRLCDKCQAMLERN